MCVTRITGSKANKGQLFDAQLAVLLNIPCLFAVSELGGASLPGDEEPWAATRASTWAAVVDERIGTGQPEAEPPVFLNVLGSLLSNKRLSRPLNDFGSALVAHTLYRSVSDRIDGLKLTTVFQSLPRCLFIEPGSLQRVIRCHVLLSTPSLLPTGSASVSS
jgi:hypothetical protein